MSQFVATLVPSTVACSLGGRASLEGDSSGEPVTLTEQRRSRWEEIPILTPAAAGGDFLQGGVTFYPGFQQTKIREKNTRSCGVYK